jgi:hypothetical protein
MTEQSENRDQVKREVEINSMTVDLETLKKQKERRKGDVHSEYDSLKDFEKHALSNNWHISQTRFHVGGIPYTLSTSKELDFNDILARRKPAVVIYKMAGRNWKEEGKKLGLEEWIVIVWRLVNGNMLRPAHCVSTRPHVFTTNVGGRNIVHEGVAVSQPTNTDNLIGNHATVKITSLPNSKEMKALVDTGATLCSMHAEKWKIDGQSVRFVCKELSPNVITLPLVSQMAVKSGDGGQEYRPVVELNIRVNGTKAVQGVQFNLNNRMHMDHPILLGANFLKQAKMLIDPNLATEGVDHVIDWDSLMETIAPMLNESVEELMVKDDIVSMMMKSDMTFSDLVKEIRKLEYASE